MSADVITRPAPRRSVWKTRKFLGPLALYLALVVLAIPFVYPLLWMVLSTFKPIAEIYGASNLFPNQWTLDALGKIFTVNPLLPQYWNSLYTSVVITAITVVFSAMAGYAFARLRFPHVNKVFFLVLSTMFLPVEVTIIPIFRWTAELGLLNTHWPLIIPMAFGPKLAIAVFIFRQFFLSLPRELEEAAMLDGMNRFSIFARIVMPLSGAPTATVVILTFLNAFNMYIEPLVFIRSPELLTVGIGLTRYQDQYGDPLYNAQLGATSLTVLPVLLVFLFAQRQFVESLSRVGLKG
ncbi:MAG: carbohydrate ABC transporter permease [Microbacteriaceae bacterium]|nr:carbohydrate ABC transporter permease [Microbacteriaceae bacterium]